MRIWPKRLLWSNIYLPVSGKEAGDSISGRNKAVVKMLCQMLQGMCGWKSLGAGSAQLWIGSRQRSSMVASTAEAQLVFFFFF